MKLHIYSSGIDMSFKVIYLRNFVFPGSGQHHHQQALPTQPINTQTIIPSLSF